MKTFKQYCEDKEHMARGINVNSDEKIAKEIIWKSIGKGMGATAIAKDPEINVQSAGIHPRSINRILTRYGLNGPVRQQIKQIASQAKSDQVALSKRNQEDYIPVDKFPRNSAKVRSSGHVRQTKSDIIGNYGEEPLTQQGSDILGKAGYGDDGQKKPRYDQSAFVNPPILKPQQPQPQQVKPFINRRKAV